jgi:hypothetical protein
MYVLFLRRIWVDMHCILIGTLRFDCLRLFFLLILGGFVLY